MPPSPPPRRPPARTGTGRCNTNIRGTNLSEGQGPKEAQLTSATIALQGRANQADQLDGRAHTRMQTVATPTSPFREDGDAAVQYQHPRDKS